MDKMSPVDNKSLKQLGFKYDGSMWVHSEEKRFAIRLNPTCFYVSFHGYCAKHPYDLTVGELEKQFYEKTGKLLF